MSQEAYGARLVAGRFRVTDALREDGAGTVWRARDEARGRDVAVREVRLPLGGGGADGRQGADGRRLSERVERQARQAARVAHPCVVAVLDVVVWDGRPWIVTELVRGLTLAETLEAEGPLPPRRAALVGARVLGALRAAHAAGVPHGAVAPGAVLLGNDGRVALTDFGTAAAGPAGEEGYRAPECGPGRPATPAGDLWSLGALLYAAVAGRPPAVAGGPAPGAGEEAAGGAEGALDAGGGRGAGGALDAGGGPPLPRGAGALAPVLGALLRPDPEARPSAEEAARLLSAVEAGGEARTVPAPGDPAGRHGAAGAGGVRRPDGDGAEDGGGAVGTAAGGVADGPAGGGAAASGRRAAAVAGAVGLVAAVVGLVVAGLVYAALR
ncbi:serine/threonine-protein kinase [Streptomyces sp. DH12]|uniref:serine/threonine-protein kinase n=1 Tax=Streptomyces sp. DH12 TaxID=2857010 RepID=UPI001E5B444C|nr:serine/threonine-protein kinase [Streptomyces sp. DH12]